MLDPGIVIAILPCAHLLQLRNDYANNKQLIVPLFTFTTPIPHYPLDLGNISYSFKFNIQYLGILISVISVIVCNCCIGIVNRIGSNSVSCLL